MPEINPASKEIADYLSEVNAGRQNSVQSYTDFQAGREAGGEKSSAGGLTLDQDGLVIILPDQASQLRMIEGTAGDLTYLNLVWSDGASEVDRQEWARRVELGRSTMPAENPTRPLATDRDNTINPGERIIIDGDRSWLVVEKTGEDGQKSLALEPETVRPQLKLAENLQDDFGWIIWGNGTVRDIKNDGSGMWLYDSGQSNNNDFIITKEGKTITVDGGKVKGGHRPISLGEDTVHLVKTKAGWEIVNHAVWQAREAAQGGEKWNVKPSEWFAGAGVGVKKFWERGVKPRGFKDAVSLLARGISESGVPYAWTAGFIIMLGNLTATGFKEIKSLWEIGDWKSYLQQTSFGQLTTGDTKTNLSRKEKNWALALGIGSSGLFLGMSEAIAKLVPGGGLWKIAINRVLLGYVAPELVALLGKKALFGKETANEGKAGEWLGLTLGVMSATITGASAALFLGEGAVGLTKLIDQRIAAMEASTQTVQPSNTAQPEITPSVIPPPTQTPTAEPTEIPPTATEVPPTEIPPTETAMPTLELLWQPGEAIDKDLLQNAAEQNYGWGVDADGDGKADFQAFWLDDKQGPDLVRDITNGYQYIRNGNDYCWDNNKDGSLSQNEINYGPFSLSGIDDSGNLEKFENTNYQDVPNLSGEEIIDISSGDIASSGKAPGHAMPAPTDALPAGGPIPDKINWDSDRAYEWLKDDKGWFADNDGDGSFNPKYDSRVVGTPDIFWDDASSRWQMNHVVFMDGGNISEWQREDGVRVWNPGTNAYEYQDGVLVGYVNDNRLRVDNGLESSGADRAQRALHDENPGFSPWKIGAMYVRGEVSVPVPEAPVVPEPPDASPEIVTEPVRGDWVTMAKANGDQVWLDAERGGIHGVVQFELHNEYSDLSPEQVTVAAHRLITDNQAEVAAFRQPAGDGNAVKAAVNDDSFVPKIQFQVNVVRIEEFLVIHSDWFKQNLANLSQGERYEVAKRAAGQWLTWGDDEAKKNGLLNIAQQVEQEFLNE